jgi:hypothetical protein
MFDDGNAELLRAIKFMKRHDEQMARAASASSDEMRRTHLSGAQTWLHLALVTLRDLTLSAADASEVETRVP